MPAGAAGNEADEVLELDADADDDALTTLSMLCTLGSPSSGYTCVAGAGACGGVRIDIDVWRRAGGCSGGSATATSSPTGEAGEAGVGETGTPGQGGAGGRGSGSGKGTASTPAEKTSPDCGEKVADGPGSAGGGGGDDGGGGDCEVTLGDCDGPPEVPDSGFGPGVTVAVAEAGDEPSETDASAGAEAPVVVVARAAVAAADASAPMDTLITGIRSA